MSQKTLKDNGPDLKEPTTKESFDEYRKKTESYSVYALLCLIAGLILISLNLRLPAGFLVIAGALIITIILKRFSRLLSTARETMNEIASSNDKKDSVINDFSHRMREPLNNLVVITDILMTSDLPGKQKELLETFAASTNNMVTSVNELTMQSAGEISFGKRKQLRFNLLSTIQNTIDLYNLKENANIDFILNKKESSDFDCYGDPIILKQIFLDIFNTIEKQESETPTKVTINLSREKTTDSDLHIGFRIQTDKRIILMEEDDTKRNLSARLISAERGYFTQELGNNFSVLKIHLAFKNPFPEPGQRVSSPGSDRTDLKRKGMKELKDIRVLLVEDNLINQKIILLTLKPIVKSIETASNGKEALEKLSTSGYDLVLMDIQMPVMSGLEAAEQIRESEAGTDSHVPIIAITANAMLGDKEKCISSGIDDYISKPFQPAQLIEKINNIFIQI